MHGNPGFSNQEWCEMSSSSLPGTYEEIQRKRLDQVTMSVGLVWFYQRKSTGWLEKMDQKSGHNNKIYHSLIQIENIKKDKTILNDTLVNNVNVNNVQVRYANKTDGITSNGKIS